MKDKNKFTIPEFSEQQKLVLAAQQELIDSEPAHQVVADMLFMRFNCFKKAGFSKDWAMQLAITYKGPVG